MGAPGCIDREIVELFIENAGVHIYEDCEQSHKFAIKCFFEQIENGEVIEQVADHYGVELYEAANAVAEFINYFENFSLID